MRGEKSKTIPKKLWDKGGRLHPLVERFTVGDDYLLDRMLLPYDCLGSIAHAKMLGKIGVLTSMELKRLVAELCRIQRLARLGKFSIAPEQEDCSTAIEQELTKRLGTLGQKIHAARSRNDQILTALRLYEKYGLRECEKHVRSFLKACAQFAKKYGRVELPGYTHTRKAMPTRIRTWIGAFEAAMKDNLTLLAAAQKLIDQSPLGTGAGYGVPLVNDRAYTARLLGFAKVQQNPIYAQMSRGKFEATILHVLTQIMFDLNKLATDLILWSMPEFGYLTLPKKLCTGSSMMPQKQNPDVLEVLRAKYHRIVALEGQVQATIGNLISGYNRDFQLTKGPTIEAFAITRQSLEIAALVVSQLSVNADRCRAALTPELYATADAHQLVKKGVPFRQAYRIIAKKFTEDL